MSETDVSLAELIRVVTRLERTIDRQSEIFVLNSVYQANLMGLRQEVAGLRDDIDEDRRDRKTLWRLTLASLVFPFMLTLLGVLLFVRGVPT